MGVFIEDLFHHCKEKKYMVTMGKIITLIKDVETLEGFKYPQPGELPENFKEEFGRKVDEVLRIHFVHTSKRNPEEHIRVIRSFVRVDLQNFEVSKGDKLWLSSTMYPFDGLELTPWAKNEFANLLRWLISVNGYFLKYKSIPSPGTG